MPLHLIGSDVAILDIEDPDITASGIVLPEQAKQRADHGLVIYVGPECSILQPNDHVIFSGYTGDRVTIEGEGTFTLMREADVLAILSDENPEGIYSYSTIERLIRNRQSELAAKTDLPDLDSFCDDILSRIRSLSYEEGFMF